MFYRNFSYRLGIALLLALLAGVCLYVLVPDTLILARIESVHVPPSSINRFLANPAKGVLWARTVNPRASLDSKGRTVKFYFHDVSYQIQEKSHPYLSVLIDPVAKQAISSSLLVIPISNDSSLLHWELNVKTSYNLFLRIRQYWEAKKLSQDMTFLLQNLSGLLMDKKQIYGIPIEAFKLTNGLILSSRITTHRYPSTQQIYRTIEQIKSQITLHGASVTDFPMIHIDENKDSSFRYSVLIGVPINKEINPGHGFSMKRMPLQGSMLKTEIWGGFQTVSRGQLQLEQYLSDIQKGSPAIPFQVLVTNRMRQPDTTKWLTYIYYPII